MIPEELKLRLWRLRFLASREEEIFLRIWHQVKNLSPTPKELSEMTQEQWKHLKMLAVLEAIEEYNPTHTVTEHRVVRMPVKKVIQIPVRTLSADGTETISFIQKEISTKTSIPSMKLITVSRASEMTLISFIRWKMDNAIRSERRAILKARRLVPLDTSYKDDEDENSVADHLFFTRLADPSKLRSVDAEEAEEAYQHLIQRVEERLIELGEHQVLKAFRLRLKHPGMTNRVIADQLETSKTYTSSYFRTLKEVIEEVIENTDTLLI